MKFTRQDKHVMVWAKPYLQVAVLRREWTLTVRGLTFTVRHQARTVVPEAFRNDARTEQADQDFCRWLAR